MHAKQKSITVTAVVASKIVAKICLKMYKSSYSPHFFFFFFLRYEPHFQSYLAMYPAPRTTQKLLMMYKSQSDGVNTGHCYHSDAKFPYVSS